MKKAFTLVELLIVVIIIGILAALAIPQYNNMVWKARFAEAYNTIGAIVRAEKVYYMEYGHYTREGRGSDSFDDCLAGGGYATGDTLVQRALNIGIPENSNFVYMIYPCAELPNNSIIYFRQPGYNEWIAYYNYDSGEWALYPGHRDNGGPAHNYFTLPQ